MGTEKDEPKAFKTASTQTRKQPENEDAKHQTIELTRRNPEDDRLFNQPTGPQLFQEWEGWAEDSVNSSVKSKKGKVTTKIK